MSGIPLAFTLLMVLGTIAGICFLMYLPLIPYVQQRRQLSQQQSCEVESSEEERGVDIDLTNLDALIASGADTQTIYMTCKHYVYLTKVEGFSSVMTLFKHRHRARALKRLATFKQEWNENGLKLYNRV